MIETYVLETGARTTLAGPVAFISENCLLMLTSGPVFPQEGILHLVKMEMRISKDMGKTWEHPKILVQGTTTGAPFPYALLKLASGRLLAIYGMYSHYSQDHDSNKCRMPAFQIISDDGGMTWSAPVLLPTGETYISSVLSCMQLSNQRVVFPFGFLTGSKGKFVVSALYSDDNCNTWHRSKTIIDVGGDGFESGGCEPTCAELPDGRIWMLIRAQTGTQWQSFSSDGGENWDSAAPSKILSSNSPAVMHRLQNGNIVIVWNNSVYNAYARHSLAAAVTRDGTSFFGMRELAHIDYPVASPEIYWGAMYPYIVEAPNGKIIVTYNVGDWNFNHVRLAVIDQEWLEQKNISEDFSDGLKHWSCLGSASYTIGATSDITGPEDNQTGASLFIKDIGKGKYGAVRSFPLIRSGLIETTMTICQPDAYLLLHDSFLKPGWYDEACLRLRFAEDGTVYAAAGTPQIKRADLPGGCAAYEYLAYPVGTEKKYQNRIQLGQRFSLHILCRLDNNEIAFNIDKGPELKIQIPNILGFSYMGVAASHEGAIKVRRINWQAM